MPPPPVTSPRAPETEVISGASQIWVDPGWVNPAGISIRSRFPAAFRDKPCHAPVCDRHVHKPWRRQASRPESLPSRGPSVPPGGWSHPWRRGPVNLTPPSPVLRASETPCPLPVSGPQSPVGKDSGPKAGPGLPKGSARQALNSRVVQSPLGSPGPRWFPAEAMGGERRGTL